MYVVFNVHSLCVLLLTQMFISIVLYLYLVQYHARYSWRLVVCVFVCVGVFGRLPLFHQ